MLDPFDVARKAAGKVRRELADRRGRWKGLGGAEPEQRRPPAAKAGQRVRTAGSIEGHVQGAPTGQFYFKDENGQTWKMRVTPNGLTDMEAV